MNVLTRRSFTSGMLSLGAASRLLQPMSLRALASEAAHRDSLFVRPGMLHTTTDLERMKSGVAAKANPIFSGFEALRADSHSQLSYRPSGGFEEVGRNPGVNIREFESDANAAYQCALMGHITGDDGYFQITAAILDSWSAKLKRHRGADAVLCAGLSPFKLTNAAELLLYSSHGWPTASADRFGKMLHEVVVPVLCHFAPFANGNWDTAAMKTLMAIAIFNEDADLFNQVLVYYRHGCGDGRLEHYIYADGQCQESGRDQQHTQLGLAHMGDCCEMAWNQGLDLYSCSENRLLTGFEYTAKYNLGVDVPFTPDIDLTGKYRHEVISPRGPFRPVYEQIYNHFVQRRGMDAPWVTKAAEQLRPEGVAFGADHTGFGTLLYSREKGLVEGRRIHPDLPIGVYVTNASEHNVHIDWVPTAAASDATVFRTDIAGRNVQAIPAGRDSADDASAVSGRLYRYAVQFPGHFNARAPHIEVCAALPKGWEADQHSGTAIFDGTAWRIDAFDDAFHFVSSTIAPGQAIAGQLSPEFASQFLRAGVGVRSEVDEYLLLAEPIKAGDKERPHWFVRLYRRHGIDAELVQIAEESIDSPTVDFSRIVRPVWFRIAIAASGRLTPAWSSDGSKWRDLQGATASLRGPLIASMCVGSGIKNVGVQTRWREVSIQ